MPSIYRAGQALDSELLPDPELDQSSEHALSEWELREQQSAEIEESLFGDHLLPKGFLEWGGYRSGPRAWGDFPDEALGGLS